MQSARQHYPQQQEAEGGSDMVTPTRASRKRFWQEGGEDGEEVENLVHRSAGEADHEPSEPDGSRSGHLWSTMTSCYLDAHQACSKMDEDSHISEHLRQELCGRWKSKSVRASVLGGVLLLILVLVGALHMSTARGPPGGKQGGSPTAQGLISAAALCAANQDLFNPASRMCKMENRIAFGAMALQSWAHCDLSSSGARILQSNMDQSGAFWYSYRQRDPVRDFYRSCVTSCATPLDTFNPQTGLCQVTEALARDWLMGCHAAAAMGHDKCTISEGVGTVCEDPSTPKSIQKVCVCVRLCVLCIHGCVF